MQIERYQSGKKANAFGRIGLNKTSRYHNAVISQLGHETNPLALNH